MTRPLLNLIHLSFCMLYLTAKLAAQCPANTPLNIDGITVTESRCQASGTATISVSGGVPPYTYELMTGPVTAPRQSNRTITALSKGTYIVEVTDNCKETTTASFSISGTYAVPAVTEILQPGSCPGLQDGSILVNVTNGRAPFTFSLITPSPVEIPEQPINRFANLPTGVYTFQVKDSCGNFQTRTVTLADDQNNGFLISQMQVRWEACDSFSVPYRLTFETGANRTAPYHVGLSLPDGRSLVHSLLASTSMVEDTFRFVYDHTKGATDWLEIKAVNGCGITHSSSLLMGLDMKVNKSGTGNCDGGYTYTMDKERDNATIPSPVHCNTITYTLLSPSGVVLVTQINNSTFSGYPPSPGYKVIREDCCAKDTILFEWEVMPPKVSPIYSVFPACKKGLAVIRLSSASGIPGRLILLTGPPSIPFGSATRSHTYPDTIPNIFNGTATATIGYFGKGTYRFCFIDACGKRDTTVVSVTANGLKNYTFTPLLQRGCVNNNKILLTGTNNNISAAADEVIIKYGSTIIRKPVPRFLVNDALLNLGPGNYQIQYRLINMSAGYFLKNMNSACELFDTTINIPVYRQPYFHNTSLIGGCNEDRMVQMKPDSSSGLLPFEYKLIAGPEIRGAQNDPIFTALSPGTYTMLMTDACGNSYSSSVAVNELINPTADVYFDCDTKSFWAGTLSSPDYQYKWIHPDGSVTTGSYLLIDPISDRDTGVYKLIATSNFSGCEYAEESSFRVDYCIVLPLGLKWFSATTNHSVNEIYWETASAQSYRSFTLERSSDGRHFTPLLTQKVSAVHRYKAIDARPLTDITWYRLTMNDHNGIISYSQSIFCNSKKQDPPLKVFPVPLQASGLLSILHKPARQGTQIQLVDIHGRIMISRPLSLGATRSSLDLRHLAKGSYLLIYHNEGRKEVITVPKLN